MVSINVFLFDLDGTIWDSELVIVDTLFNTILEEVSINVPKNTLLNDLRRYRSPLKVLSTYGIYTHNSYWKKYRHSSEGIVLFNNETSRIFDELLGHKKFIGYITSLRKEFTIKLLNKFRLYEYASVLITPSECRASKPNPKPVLLALEKLSVEGNEAIYIGDQDIDIIAAKRAGCKAGLASWGAHEGMSESPDYVFDALEDALLLVRGKK